MAEEWKVGYDRRQCRLMSEQLQHFEDGVVDLGALIEGLTSLLACLEASDQNWKSDFQSECWKLEEIYAVALNRVEQGATRNVESTINEPTGQAHVQSAVKTMWRLLADRIAEESNPDYS